MAAWEIGSATGSLTNKVNKRTAHVGREIGYLVALLWNMHQPRISLRNVKEMATRQCIMRDVQDQKVSILSSFEGYGSWAVMKAMKLVH